MEKKLILTGLGGQGVVFLTRLLSYTAVSLNHPVIVSETHGMSRRGGSVMSHLKIGGSKAPLIRRGTADILIALESNEAVRNLAFLRRGGIAFVNAENGLPPELDTYLQQMDIQLHCLPANQIAVQLGSAAIANTIMAGFAHPFPIENLRQAVTKIASHRQELNLEALALGYQQSIKIEY